MKFNAARINAGLVRRDSKFGKERRATELSHQSPESNQGICYEKMTLGMTHSQVLFHKEKS